MTISTSRRSVASRFVPFSRCYISSASSSHLLNNFSVRYAYAVTGGLSEKKPSTHESMSSEIFTKTPTTAMTVSRKSDPSFQSQSQSVSEEEEEDGNETDESDSKKDSKTMKVVQRVDNELSKIILLLEENPKIRELVDEIQKEEVSICDVQCWAKLLQSLQQGIFSRESCIIILKLALLARNRPPDFFKRILRVSRTNFVAF